MNHIIKAWSEKATAQTTLWFWNSEIGWAAVHPILEKYGWRFKAWSEKATAQTTLWFWNSEIGWATVHPILEKYGWRFKAWSEKATAQTTLWFWNSEIGWAAVHPILEKYGWRYVNCNVWNKGKGHIAGNVNTAKIRRFPVVSEVCVQYVFEARIEDMLLKDWLRKEWRRTGMPMRKANEACGVKDAAVRKYLDAGHLWYFPPSDMFGKMADYANLHGEPDGCPLLFNGWQEADDWCGLGKNARKV